MKKAFEFAVDYCKEKGLDYEYMGNVDGDIIIENRERIFREANKRI